MGEMIADFGVGSEEERVKSFNHGGHGDTGAGRGRKREKRN